MNSFSDLVRVRNLETGKIGHIARHLFNNPRINNGILEEVDEKAKPYINYKSKVATGPEDEPETPSEEEVTDA